MSDQPKLDLSKPCQTIFGRYEEVPGARYVQGGVHFDARGRPLCLRPSVEQAPAPAGGPSADAAKPERKKRQPKSPKAVAGGGAL